MKIRHSGKKSDNLGTDTPRSLNNRLHPTWSFTGGDCLGFLTGICSLFSRLILGTARHFFLLCYQTAIWQLWRYMSSWHGRLTPLKSQVPLHRRVANSETRIHRSHRADHVAKQAAMRGFSVGQWLDWKKERKKNLRLLWRWFQMKSVPVKAPLKNGSTLCHCQMIWVWGCSLQILFLHFKDGVRDSALDSPPSNRFVC